MRGQPYGRWNIASTLTTMDGLREALDGGADALNWFLIYSLVPSSYRADGEETCGLRAEHLGHRIGPKAVYLDAYVLMPRVGGCARVEEVEIIERADLIWVCEQAAASLAVHSYELSCAVHIGDGAKLHARLEAS